jgi:hypothetical protein
MAMTFDAFKNKRLSNASPWTRMAMLMWMKELGHEVTVLGDVIDPDNLKGLAEFKPWDKVARDQQDALLVECSSTNAHFGTIPKFYSFIKDFHGRVCYLQFDAALNFMFYPENYNLLQRKVPGRITSEDLFKHITWAVASEVLPKDLAEFRLSARGNRFKYDICDQVSWLRIPWADTIMWGCQQTTQTSFPPRDQHDRMLVYIGNDRPSRRKFVEEFFPVDGLPPWLQPRTIFGNWDRANCAGKLHPEQVLTAYNLSRYTVTLNDKLYHRAGLVGHRWAESILSRCVTMFYPWTTTAVRDHHGLDFSQYEVSNREEMVEMIQRLDKHYKIHQNQQFEVVNNYKFLPNISQVEQWVKST